MKSFCTFQNQAGRALVLALGISGLGLTPFAARADTVTISKTGTPVPGGDTVDRYTVGLSFAPLPILNDAGEVVFLAALTGNSASNRAILRGTGGPLTALARTGGLAPDGVSTYTLFGQPAMNNNGHVVFSGAETSSGSEALYRLSSTNAQKLAQGLQPLPNDEAGRQFQGFPPAIQFPPRPNSRGHIAFRGEYTVGSESSLPGLFWADDATVHTIALYDGTNYLGGRWRSLSSQSSLNDSNEFAFGGDANYPSSSLRTAYFVQRVGELPSANFGFQGNPEPGGDGLYAAGLYGTSAINQRGEFAFGSDLTGTSKGTTNNLILYLASISNQLVQISRKGDPAPGGVGRIDFTGIFTPKINEAGQVAFRTTLAGPGVGTTNDTGIFVGSGDALTQIVRENQLTPTLTNTLVGRMGNFSSDFPLNDAGQVAIVAQQLLGVNGNNLGQGIFTGDGTDLICVTRHGTPYESATLTGFSVGRHGLNRHGQLAFLASLSTFQTSVILLWTPDLHWRFHTNGAWNAARRWTLSLMPAAMHHVFIQPTNAVLVTGPTNDVTVRSLNLGNATLQLQPGATLTATGGLFVATNTILSGNGALVASFTNLGTISPGASAGALAVTGDVTFATSSVFVAELGGTAPVDFDQLHVQGNLSITGALQVTFINGHTLGAGQTYPIVTASGTQTGQFSGLSEGALVGNFGGRDLFLTYTNGEGNDLALFTLGASNALTLRIVSAHPPVLEFNAAAGLTYAVEGRTNVASGAWSVIGTAPAGPARNEQVIDTSATTATKTYRLRTP